MHLLKYKYIGKEEHLTFDSIRRLVFHQLSAPVSAPGERKARKHLQDCYRCHGIYECLARPGKVRKNRSKRRAGSRMFSSVLLIIGLIGFAACFLYFKGASDLNFKNLSDLFITGLQRMGNREITRLTPIPPELGPSHDFKRNEPVHLLKNKDTLPQSYASAEVGTTSGVLNQSNSYLENEGGQQTAGLRGIYGRITAEGEALKGVTVMVPGGSTAKVSDSTGMYYIQVPLNIASLVFIYRGKKLVKELDPTSRKRDVNLEIEKMIYPKIETPETHSDIIVSN